MTHAYVLDMRKTMNQLESFSSRWVLARTISEVRSMLPTRRYVSVSAAYTSALPKQGMLKAVTSRYAASANHEGVNYFAIVSDCGLESGEFRDVYYL